jgi:hypothetical protein
VHQHNTSSNTGTNVLHIPLSSQLHAHSLLHFKILVELQTCTCPHLPAKNPPHSTLPTQDECSDLSVSFAVGSAPDSGFNRGFSNATTDTNIQQVPLNEATASPSSKRIMSRRQKASRTPQKRTSADLNAKAVVDGERGGLERRVEGTKGARERSMGSVEKSVH